MRQPGLGWIHAQTSHRRTRTTSDPSSRPRRQDRHRGQEHPPHQIDVRPAKASKSKDRLRPTKSTFDYFAGTNDGSRLPDNRNLVVHLGGARFGFNSFPKCDETDAKEQGDSVCPDGSLVGAGDGCRRSAPRSHRPEQGHGAGGRREGLQRRARHRQNGEPIDPRPGLLVYTEIADSNVVIPFWARSAAGRLRCAAQTRTRIRVSTASSASRRSTSRSTEGP